MMASSTSDGRWLFCLGCKFSALSLKYLCCNFFSAPKTTNLGRGLQNKHDSFNFFGCLQNQVTNFYAVKLDQLFLVYLFCTQPPFWCFIQHQLDSLLRLFVFGKSLLLPRVFVLGFHSLGFSSWVEVSCWIHSLGFRLREKVSAGFTPQGFCLQEKAPAGLAFTRQGSFFGH